MRIIYRVLFIALFVNFLLPAYSGSNGIEAQKAVIEEEIKSIMPQRSTIRYTKVPRGIILSVAQTELFDGDNSVQISADGKILLKKIADLLNKFENNCTIEAHTENLIDNGVTKEADWEISIIRASKLADFLETDMKIEQSRIFPIGFGEIMPFKDNVAPVDFPDNRIDFVIFDYTVSR